MPTATFCRAACLRRSKKPSSSRAGDDRIGILSLWHRRADLDALLASGEEPPARRLIREHGGDPEATFWEVALRGSAVAGPSE